jgi:hypothetical protein
MHPEPYPIGSKVRLKKTKAIFTVVRITADIDTGATTVHPRNPDGTQHYYHLERDGKPAYWYHSQLTDDLDG